MNLYFIKTPNYVQKLFSNLIWSFSSSNKDLYLTFDDGPTPEITEWTLDTLKKFNAKATFFCIGKNINNHPDIYNKIIQEGHAIGNHTHNHLNGWKTSTSTYLKNISKAEKVLARQTETSKLFRPPYGKIKTKQSRLLIRKGYKIIMWDVLSADFDQSITPEKCLQNVLKNTEKGSVIIFHDSVKASRNMKYALPKVLDHFSKKGYKFKAFS